MLMIRVCRITICCARKSGNGTTVDGVLLMIQRIRRRRRNLLVGNCSIAQETGVNSSTAQNYVVSAAELSLDR